MKILGHEVPTGLLSWTTALGVAICVSAMCARAQSLDSALLATMAKVYVANHGSRFLLRGPSLFGQDTLTSVKHWVERLVTIDTSMSLRLLSQANNWQDEFVVYQAPSRGLHSDPYILAVACDGSRIYPLVGFPSTDYGDLQGRFLEPVENVSDAQRVVEFHEYIMRGGLYASSPGGTCANREYRSIRVDTIGAIAPVPNKRNRWLPDPLAQYSVKLFRTRSAGNLALVYAVTYLLDRSGIIDESESLHSTCFEGEDE